VGQVVEPDMLGGAFLGGKDAQFALGAGHGLLVRSVRVFERDLAVAGAAGDQERHSDLLDHAVKVDLAGELDEFLEYMCSLVESSPFHMIMTGAWPLSKAGAWLK
jgi:hypothetical protein